jgi:hypothetical protein
VGINGDNAYSMFVERMWNPSIGFWASIALFLVGVVAVALVTSKN